MVKDIPIHSVLNAIRVGNDFLILAHINSEEVAKVKNVATIFLFLGLNQEL